MSRPQKNEYPSITNSKTEGGRETESVGEGRDRNGGFSISTDQRLSNLNTFLILKFRLECSFILIWGNQQKKNRSPVCYSLHAAKTNKQFERESEIEM